MGIDPSVLRAVLDANRSQQEIEITYQPVSPPDLDLQWVAPHALAFDCFTLHASARWVRDRPIKDVVLAEMPSPANMLPPATDIHGDKTWHQRVRTAIAPPPLMLDGQRKGVEADYCMTRDVAVMDVRASFLWYFLKRFEIEVNAAAKSPKDQHIILLNREGVLALLASRQEA